MSIFSSIKDKIAEYVELYIKLAKLNFMGSTARLIGYFMFALICLLLVACIMILLGFGIAEGFVELGMGRVAAFFTTVGVYVFLLLVLIGLRKNITHYFAGSFISVMTEGEDEKTQHKVNP